MSHYDTTNPGGPGERWNVNLPAVIGVVFVFLVGVIVWVITSSAGDETPAAGDPATTLATGPGDTTALTTTPPPMPDVSSTDATGTETTGTETTSTETTGTETTAIDSTVAETTASEPPATSTTTVPVTTAPGATDGAVPGDLGIPGRPMQRPACDDSYITILASAVGDQATAVGIAAVLDTYPNSEYLRTDQTCSSLRSDVDGAPIYVVYLGPFVFDTDACAARAEGPEGAYAKSLSNDVGPDQVVPCT